MLPAGGQVGQVTRIGIDGKALAGAVLHFSGGGIELKGLAIAPTGDRLTADLQLTPGAALGPHELRVTTPKGVSNAVRFWADVLPNRTITPPADGGPMPLTGDKLEVINGRIPAKAGRDRYEITVATGETWVFDCVASRMRSRLDPVLELTDEAGVSVRLVQSTWESDPRFEHKFAKAGKYILTVRDSEYNGGPNFTYRLTSGHSAWIAGWTPRGGRPGEQVQLSLVGENLPASSASVTIPQTAQGTYWTAAQSACGPMLIPLLVDSAPVLEAEGAHTLPSLPADVDGVFARAPSARFTFRAEANAKYVLDLYGRRIGSRIDGAIRVLDAAGKQVAEADDTPDLAPKFFKDARLTFAPAAAGEYTVEVRNVEEATGPDCYFRLRARAVLPDFEVAIATDRLAIPAGGTIALPVSLTRLGGFDRAVNVRVDGLPAGVTCSGGVIPAGKGNVELTLTAAPGASVSAAGVHVLGTATVAGKELTHEAPAWEKYEHRSIDLLLSVEYSYPRPHYLWEMLLAAVTERTDPVTLTLEMPTATLATGGKLEIPVHAARQPGANAEIKFELRNLPAKVTAAAPPIPGGQSDGKITLTAAADAQADLTNVIVQAHHDKATVLAPALRLNVRKP